MLTQGLYGLQNGPRTEYNVGAHVMCKATFDSNEHLAEIIERREDAENEGFMYYVHYSECTLIKETWLGGRTLLGLKQTQPSSRWRGYCKRMCDDALVILRWYGV